MQSGPASVRQMIGDFVVNVSPSTAASNARVPSSTDDLLIFVLFNRAPEYLGSGFQPAVRSRSVLTTGLIRGDFVDNNVSTLLPHWCDP
jgi:hypothetical protein